MKLAFRSGVLLATAALVTSMAHAENVKVAFIDPFSGPFARITEHTMKSFRVTEEISRKREGSNQTIEFVPFDNKGSAQETLVQLKSAIDQGYRYVTQGVGSGAAAAMIDAVDKHNARNPGKEVVYMDWAAGDPDLTNAKCSFWHFRMDPHSDMKVEAYTTFMAFMVKDRVIKKIYLINQNFPIGQQTSRAAKEYFKRKRPDLEIVGDDLHPLGQVKDFSPYIAKIKASGADSVLTSNFGVDLSLLINAAKEANLKVNFYTFSAQGMGVPSAIGAAGEGLVTLLANFHPNIEGFPAREEIEAMRNKHDDDFVVVNTSLVVTLLQKGFQLAKSTDPVKVAFAMEGMKFKGLTGEFELRKSDHQLQQPLFIATWTKINGKDVKYDQEKTGYGWKTVYKLPPYVAAQSTSCDMKRPAK